MTYTMLYGNIIVQRDAVQEKSDGGILYADKFAKSRNIGTVTAVGSMYTNEHGVDVYPIVRVGDRVIYGPEIIYFVSEHLAVINQRSILAIVTD